MSTLYALMQSRPPNILYLHCHDAGRYIQPYGYPVVTPNLQRLAEEGILYRNAHCANPTCSPSRACLLTGQYAHNNGMLGLAHRGFRLNDYQHHLANQLRAAGYTSALAGTQHIAAAPLSRIEDIGYDQILTTEEDFETPTAAAENYFAKPPEKPFFLSLGYFAPHRTDDGAFPRQVDPPNPDYLRPPAPIPDSPETRADFANYAASIQSLDISIGRVLDALDRSGLADNTLVIATTDHGIAFPAMKCNLTDHGTGVMLILRGPGGFRGGQVVESLVSQIDLAPTVLELAGLPLPERLQGQSLLPNAEGKVTQRDSVFAEINYHATEEPSRSVRTQRWKYICRFKDYGYQPLPNCDDGPSKDYWIQNGWLENGYEQELLFDLTFDPNESRNLAPSPAHAEALHEMRARLDQWMRETDDPLLKGPLPRNEHTVITAPTERSPKGKRLG
ncbi:sulfatase [Pelagicoccus enzymogenes]|uniref:sulfatase family protein n=1 Tax=Pelagicoccus enzymogenes TaxID=2773457 RepID=UPI00280E2F5F|nr:sulfatase [Pelagicoccus enzymogenes]MDQ8197062.1 sulfatase [Pelagicoccus enzymogenes]